MKPAHWIVTACVLVLLSARVEVMRTPVAAADQATDTLQRARTALGGEDALAKVKAIAAKGTFRREMGPRQMEGVLTVTIERPDRMHRSEDMEMMGGASMERITALARDTSWEDTQNRGGMGGGMMMQMVMRGPNGEQATPEQMAEMRTRRMKVELNRWLLAFFASSDQPMTYAGTAEAPEGKAEVLEIKDERGQAVRLFVDQQSGMPLMLTYQELRPRMMVAGGGPGGPGGPGAGGQHGPGAGPGQGGQRADPEEMRRRLEAEGPPPPTTVHLFLADYKEVKGVKLPHRITESVDGKPVMEWAIEKFEVNPKIKADLFDKKK
jgi:hypothetical protein